MVEVQPPERATYELELTDAAVRFTWFYEELIDNRTRLSQHIVLGGPGAEAYFPVMEAHFAPNVGQGMGRLAEEIGRYAAARRSGLPGLDPAQAR